MSIRSHEHGTPRAYPRAKRGSRRTQTRTATALAPAAARQPTALRADELDLAGDAIETFTTAVGGRKQLLETLAVADSDTAATRSSTACSTRRMRPGRCAASAPTRA